MSRILGVDPGLSGALAFRDTKTGKIVVVDMPVKVLSTRRVRGKSGKMRDKVKRVVDGKAVGDFIEEHRPSDALVELVASRPGQGVSTTFTFGESFGAVVGALEAMNVRVHRVPPAVWKKKAGLLGTSKKASLTLARKRFPTARHRLTRVKDNGRAEALLISEHPILH